MNRNLITALAAVPGSLSGASAAIATTWIAQRSQTIRERVESETRKRETLYGEFITEASQQLASAFDHSLDKPETLVKLYAILGHIAILARSGSGVNRLSTKLVRKLVAQRRLRIKIDAVAPV
jgi:hypothetical protein